MFNRLASATATVCFLLTLGLAATRTATAADGTSTQTAKSLKHVVLFKFKDGTSAQQVEEVVSAFKALKGKIDEIVDFEYGTDVSVENRSQGFTHCFLATFRDAKGRDTYLNHPAHTAFGGLVGPRLDKVLVVDFWTEK